MIYKLEKIKGNIEIINQQSIDYGDYAFKLKKRCKCRYFTRLSFIKSMLNYIFCDYFFRKNYKDKDVEINLDYFKNFMIKEIDEEKGILREINLKNFIIENFSNSECTYIEKNKLKKKI